MSASWPFLIGSQAAPYFGSLGNQSRGAIARSTVRLAVVWVAFDSSVLVLSNWTVVDLCFEAVVAPVDHELKCLHNTWRSDTSRLSKAQTGVWRGGLFGRMRLEDYLYVRLQLVLQPGRRQQGTRPVQPTAQLGQH
ncbi:hypothetical protein NHX12_009766 [Muraenolepis orangiensis]|uniref:Uncharacterized protein n=1 Tax=Muraenolepis orangiensis TaxID=630683 RepID=A0A9Q0I6N4_9TELE|nr:hypothetical protein NHX12_009766 [Muraenolepis orangiensis]